MYVLYLPDLNESIKTKIYQYLRFEVNANNEPIEKEEKSIMDQEALMKDDIADINSDNENENENHNFT